MRHTVANTRHCARWAFRGALHGLGAHGLSKRLVRRRMKPQPLREKLEDDREWMRFTRNQRR